MVSRVWISVQLTGWDLVVLLVCWMVGAFISGFVRAFLGDVLERAGWHLARWRWRRQHRR